MILFGYIDLSEGGGELGSPNLPTFDGRCARVTGPSHQSICRLDNDSNLDGLHSFRDPTRVDWLGWVERQLNRAQNGHAAYPSQNNCGVRSTKPTQPSILEILHMGRYDLFEGSYVCFVCQGLPPSSKSDNFGVHFLGQDIRCSSDAK